jgi:hypothetical protein
LERKEEVRRQMWGARFIALVMVPGIMDHERFVRGTNPAYEGICAVGPVPGEVRSGNEPYIKIESNL